MQNLEIALVKVRALIARDLADLLANPGASACLAVPAALVVLQVLLLGGDVSDVSDASDATVRALLLQSALCISVALVASVVVLYSLAEEREKRMLRTLVLSGASLGQILISKALMGIVVLLTVSLTCFGVLAFMLPGVDGGLLPAYLASTLMGGAATILPALALALISRDQMAASFSSVPVLLLAIAPIFGSYGGLAASVVRLIPTGGACELLYLLVSGALSWADVFLPLMVSAAWAVLGFGAFRLFCRRAERGGI